MVLAQRDRMTGAGLPAPRKIATMFRSVRMESDPSEERAPTVNERSLAGLDESATPTLWSLPVVEDLHTAHRR